ncbi:hypothetical protein BDZ94DRAFT_1047424 [Collybia nuda]|uniref:Uncharacterized protein n=1 Tax=Collybia nuda TaxID=64659 RepID=A0A9P5XYA8_9AGAR|nr:hypothetical protein BDZ94DRAFT_1047424 [Collybia nuda]
MYHRVTSKIMIEAAGIENGHGHGYGVMVIHRYGTQSPDQVPLRSPPSFIAGFVGSRVSCGGGRTEKTLLSGISHQESRIRNQESGYRLGWYYPLGIPRSLAQLAIVPACTPYAHSIRYTLRLEQVARYYLARTFLWQHVTCYIPTGTSPSPRASQKTELDNCEEGGGGGFAIPTAIKEIGFTAIIYTYTEKKYVFRIREKEKTLILN